MHKLIAAVEELLKDPDDFKPYEDNYKSGWVDACNRVLELLHAEPERLTVAQIKELPDNGENFIWEDPRGTGWIDLDGTFSRDDLQQLANSLPIAASRSEND